MPDTAPATAWEASVREKREGLVRLCAVLTGDPEAGQDLAQQTLYEAWRLRGRQRGPHPDTEWLAAIARRVYLRWRRAHAAEMARYAPLARNPEADEQGAAEHCDVQAELERSELLDLLDRSMALLPAATRDILVERFVRESPHAAIAERLGLSEGAVTMRLQRGKLMLRRILTTRFREEASAFGLTRSAPAVPEWAETRIWCPECGVRRLRARWREGRRLELECWGCNGHPRALILVGWSGELYWSRTCAEILAGVTAFKPAASRLLAANYEAYRHGIAAVRAKCLWCLRPAPVYMSPRGDVRTRCRHCGADNGISTTGGVAFSHPAMQAFWRRHGRIRSLPDRHVETAGLPAVICRTESVTDGSTLEVVLARDTLVPLGVHGAPHA